MKYYLAGPMSGLPDFNYTEFGLAALLLRERGLDIYSPHEGHDNPGQQPYAVYFKAGIKKLLICDAIVMLHGWERSEGALFEFKLAVKLDMKVFTFDTKTCTLEEMSCLKEKDISPSNSTQSPGL